MTEKKTEVGKTDTTSTPSNTLNVRVISQAEFDGMVSGQQKFFLALIEQGKAKIAEPAPTATAAAPERHQSPVQRYLGKNVLVYMVDGRMLGGELIEVSQYELLLIHHSGTDGDSTHIIFKGNVTSIECLTVMDGIKEEP